MEKNIPIAQREQSAPTQFTEFLWWLSTAEKELLADAVVDRNRYKIVGMTVLATWAFATLAWTYFFSTVTSNSWMAYPLGFLMGFIILTIDRALIKGISKQNKNRLWPLFFRAMLAITIGTFMAQPALLYMFKKEIKLQTAADNERKKIQNTHVLDSLYKNHKAEIATQKAALQNELQVKYELVSKARENFLAEADGSGGTGKVGIKNIALAKKNEYEKLDTDYKQLLAINQPKIDQLDTATNDIDSKIEQEQQAYTQNFNDGFLTQIEALNNLIKENGALQTRYYLLVAILLLIELMPVIAKTLLPSGTYDERVMLREELEKEMAHNNIRREQELKELYNTSALQSDRETIAAFFNLTKTDREEKIKTFSNKWKTENHQTFDGLWEKMKKEILTKQEN
ncbi:MAG: DUF4407 domain-containing protein [Chitinophagaceae bacterium]|nr:DUF4407 domain-containing protein [Chitinophagaceae bacterium]